MKKTFVKHNKPSTFFTFLFLSLFCVLNTQTSYAQMQPPLLDCVNRAEDGSGVVELTWRQNPTSGCGTSHEGYFIFVADDLQGPYTLIDSVSSAIVSQFTYTDNNASTQANNLFYFIRERCAGIFSTTSDTLDTALPIPPVISSVTVGNDSINQLSWLPSPSPEAGGYIIFKANLNGGFEEYDTILAPNISLYIDSMANAGERPEAYKIATFDQCTGEVGPDNDNPHQTIFLNANVDDCNKRVNLSWTRYLGWTDGVKEYYLLSEVEGNTPVDTIPGNENTAIYNLPEGESATCLRVFALRNNNIENSNSNAVCVDLDSKNTLDYICLTSVSVNPNNDVQISWNMDSINRATSIKIFRAVADSNNLQWLETLPESTNFTGTMSFMDNDSDPTRNTLYYSVLHEDECGRSLRTEIGSTILLNGREQFELGNVLDWSPFTLNNAILQNYVIYRQDGTGAEFLPVGTVDPDVLTFNDSDLAIGASSFCYRIEAKYVAECDNGDSEVQSSYSNNYCIQQSSRLYVPNAFAPNSGSDVNRLFKPIIVYPNANDYSMLVMNRWGEKVFSTTNIDDGWDGNHKGDLAPQGVYVYIIRMKTESGFLIERKGSVVLVR